MEEWIGIDIGGTKIAVVRSDTKGNILEKKKINTSHCKDWKEAVSFIAETSQMMKNKNCLAAGISCGGPLDHKTGRILSPPNLPGWDDVPIVKLLSKELDIPVYLQNDADACALAEWKYGAGRGARNMVFCTFGTGMGAGLILGNRLYSGRNNGAGEIGHIRMENFGPAGYGKEGSLEGFISGSGMAQMGRTIALAALQRGEKPSFCKTKKELSQITAKSIAQAAARKDITALEVMRMTGKKLGEGMAILMDILNPDIIVIGSIFVRCEEFLRTEMVSLSLLSR